MRNIIAKTDNVGDTLKSDAFNANLRTEIQAVVTDTGQTLDPEAGPDTDQDMLGKALAYYSSDGGFYQDSGAADAYVLGRVGNIQPVPAYFDGQQIVFVAGNTNTGATTVNVTTLGSKAIRRVGGAVLSAGDIAAGAYISCRFDLGNDYFEFIGFIVPASETTAGISAIATLVEALAGLNDTKFITSLKLAGSVPLFKEFQSTGQTITSGAQLPLTHGLAVEPKTIEYILECTTAEHGYSIGDRVPTSPGTDNVFNTPTIDATDITIRFSNNASCFRIGDKATGAIASITNASWELYVNAWA